MQNMYGEHEWKMSGYKTKYSTDEKQLYISDVNSYYNFVQNVLKYLFTYVIMKSVFHFFGP